jgi:hypothetical protein
MLLILCLSMSHVSGYYDWQHNSGHSTLDSRGTRSTQEECPLYNGTQVRKNSAVDALTLASRDEAAPNIYSQSDAKVIQGWKDSRSRVLPSQEAGPGTAQPRFKWSIGSPASDRRTGYATYGRQPRNLFERAETLAGDITAQPPECPICFDAYCDDDPAKVPRNLQCGHSCCTGTCSWTSAALSLIYK